MKRPPPLDASKQHSALYDSVVDCTSSPQTYVIFNCDQAYPSHVIEYLDETRS
jgi:hypothetical protein